MFRKFFPIVIIAVLTCWNVKAQTDTVITKLSGFVDNNGVPQLIYQIRYTALHNGNDTIRSDYYIFNTQSRKSDLKFESYNITSNTNPPPGDAVGKYVSGYHFFDNDLSQFIYAYNYSLGDVSCSIATADSEIYIGPGTIDYMQAFGDSVWLNYNNTPIVSSDRGKTWPTSVVGTPHPEFNLIAISPFNHNIFFGIDNYGNLIRSVDQGKTSEVVMELYFYWDEFIQLFFDPDGVHTYAFIRSIDGSNVIRVSDNVGSSGNWEFLFNATSGLTAIATDDSTSGSIYYSDDNNIYFSNDYGKNFTLYRIMPQKVTGLYKAPNTGLLYCSTQSGIYELTYDTMEKIKSFDIKRCFELYPLAVGNKWIYHTTGWSDGDTYYHQAIDEMSTVEITGDTIMSDDLRYYKLKGDHSLQYIRIDSTTGKVNYFSSYNAAPVADLLAVPGNDFSIIYGYVDTVRTSSITVFDKERFSISYSIYSLNINYQKYVQGIGLYQEKRSLYN